MAAAETVSKGEFAKLKGVTAGRVSQWISEGKITAEALEGEGRFAKIRVSVANAQLRDRLDVVQMMGNGLTTQLDEDAAEDELPLGAPVAKFPTRNPIDEAIRRARLEQLQRTNRQAEREDLAERGIYTLTADARAAMVGVASGMLNTFEGALADFATALAGRFQLPQRDVLHLLRTEFRTVRTRAADVARRRAASLSDIVEHAPEPEPADAAA